MATRYWIGQPGRIRYWGLTRATAGYGVASDKYWYEEQQSYWSTKSGGVIGATPPGAGDIAIFDANSNDCYIINSSNQTYNDSNIVVGEIQAERFSGTLNIGVEYIENSQGDLVEAKIVDAYSGDLKKASPGSLTVDGDCQFGSLDTTLDETTAPSPEVKSFRNTSNRLENGFVIKGELNSRFCTYEDLNINLWGTQGTITENTTNGVNSLRGHVIYSSSSTLTDTLGWANQSGPTITTITTVAELQAITNDLDGHYELGNDIDLTGVDWITLATGTAGGGDGVFGGTFDGKGYTISNLDSNSTSVNKTTAGLFGFIGDRTGAVTLKYGRILNLNMVDSTIAVGDSNGCGGICAYIISGSVSNCNVTNLVVSYDTLTGDNGVTNIGGIVGYAVGYTTNTVISDCTVNGFTARVTNDQFIGYAGGILGSADWAATDVEITNCQVTGVDIYGGWGSFSVGGLIGSNYACITNKCHSQGDIVYYDTHNSSSTDSIGGLIGGNYYGSTYSNCYSDVDILITFTGNGCGAYGVGGLMGYSNANSRGKVSIDNCYSRGSITITMPGTSKTSGGVGGFIGSSNDGSYSVEINNCYSVGVVTTPTFDTNPTYVGGLIGRTTSNDTTLSNCAWWTGSFTHAIGQSVSNAAVDLETYSLGTDEPDNDTFKDTTDHVVYGLNT